MIKQGHLGTLELFTTLCIYQTITLLYHLPNALGDKAFTGAWLLNLIANGVSVLVFLFLYLLLRRFPGNSIVEIGEIVLGKPGSLLVTGLVSCFYVYLTVISLRSLGDAINSSILLRTPVWALLVAALMGTVLLSYLGLEVISRVGMIFAPFMFAGFFLVILLSLPQDDWSALYPLMGKPLPNLLADGGQLGIIIHDCFFLAVINPYIRKGKGILNLALWSIILVGIFSTIIVVVIESSLPYPAFKLVSYPILETVRLINVGRFLQRLEALLIVMGVVIAMVHISISFHMAVLVFTQGFKLHDWRPLILPLAVIVYCLTLLFSSSLAIARWYYSLINIVLAGVTFILFPLALFTLAVVRRRKGEDTLENPAN